MGKKSDEEEQKGSAAAAAGGCSHVSARGGCHVRHVRSGGGDSRGGESVEWRKRRSRAHTTFQSRCRSRHHVLFPFSSSFFFLLSAAAAAA